MGNLKLDRRKFVSSLGALGIAGLCPVPSFAKGKNNEKDGDDKAIIRTAPYLQSPMPDRITVRWLTNVPCYSWVEYGPGEDMLLNKAFAGDYGLVEANNTMHEICLNKLEAGKKYYYRICSKEILKFEPYQISYGQEYIGDILSFNTPAIKADSVSFLVFNDIHDRPKSFPHLMQFAKDETYDFVFLNGDMFNYQSGEDQLVNHLLDPLSSLFSTHTPFYFSRGNHETRGCFARQTPTYFNSREQNFYFSFQQGPVYVIVLDSGEDKEDEAPVYAGLADFDHYRLQQAEWLKEEINKKAFKKAKYKLVFSHIPLYYSGDRHGTMHCRKVWGPILNKANIDLLISGHTHKYGIHPPVKDEHNYPIVIGGGPLDGARTIMKVKADQKSLTLDMLDDNGKNVGRIKI